MFRSNISFNLFILKSTLECHHSCKTCNGPYYDNCLSCLDNSGRVYDLQTCNCADGKIDIVGECEGIYFIKLIL